jgi:rubrerythrin
MSFTTVVRRWFSDGDDVIFECRNCGTLLEATEWTCSSCGSIEVAAYDRTDYETT